MNFSVTPKYNLVSLSIWNSDRKEMGQIKPDTDCFILKLSNCGTWLNKLNHLVWVPCLAVKFYSRRSKCSVVSATYYLLLLLSWCIYMLPLERPQIFLAPVGSLLLNKITSGISWDNHPIGLGLLFRLMMIWWSMVNCTVTLWYSAADTFVAIYSIQ